MKIIVIDERLPGEKLKRGPILLFSVMPCLMKSVKMCIPKVLGIIVKIEIGTSFVICLVSSICVTVQSIHGEFCPVFIAALSRKLQAERRMRVCTLDGSSKFFVSCKNK